MSLQISRADRSVLAVWWFTVDRALLTAVLALVVLGVFVSLAASPSVAEAKGLSAFYFVKRHILFAAAGTTVMFAVSLLPPRGVRRLALVVFAAAVAALIYIAVDGETINGARRWIRLLGLSVQPSEAAKPAFVVLVAWAFAEMQRRADVPALPVAVGLFALFAGLLVAQPDIGQTMLVTLVWGALFLLSGMPLVWAGTLVGIAAAGLALTYVSLQYVQKRIDLFLSGEISDTSQMGRAYQSFTQGGFFGQGPGEGTIKLQLPDAHTDFIFAVIAEEYGVIACLAIVLLFAFIVFRALLRAAHEPDLSVRYGIAGLALLIGFQALINMGVNVGLLPAKGMTLPMISSGGSSIMGIALGFGMLLALSRRRPQTARMGRAVATAEPAVPDAATMAGTD
jgi:cell division protein FtsW